jgi:L-fuculose-phosphate aldolase
VGTTDSKEIRTEIIAIGQTLLAKGLVAGTWGNVSARIPGTNLLAITPSGRNYNILAPEDIVIVDINGNKIRGGEPSSELLLHLAIYSCRPEIKATVHTHSVFASACAVARRQIPPVIEDLVQVVGGEIPVAEYALPGTAELAQNAATALKDKQAVLLANHGMIGCGTTLGEALLVCELVEKAAQIYVYANLIGGAVSLSKEDVAVMHQFYQGKYRQRQKGED